MAITKDRPSIETKYIVIIPQGAPIGNLVHSGFKGEGATIAHSEE